MNLRIGGFHTASVVVLITEREDERITPSLRANNMYTLRTEVGEEVKKVDVVYGNPLFSILSHLRI